MSEIVININSSDYFNLVGIKNKKCSQLQLIQTTLFYSELKL